MATDRIDSFFDIEKLEQEKQRILSVLNEVMQNLSEVAKKAVEMNEAFGKNATVKDTQKEMSKLNEEVKKQTDLEKQLQKEKEKLLLLEEAQYKELERLRQQATERKQQIKDEIKLEQSAEDSLEQKRLQLKKLVKEYDSMGGAVAKSTTKGKELQKTIFNLTQEIKDSEAATNRHQRNVGNYSSAFGMLKGKVQDVAKSLGMSDEAMQRFGNAGSKIGSLVTQLGLVVGAAALIKKGFETMRAASDSFGDKITETMEGGKQATNAFFRSIAEGDWSNLIGKMREAYWAGVEYARQLDILEEKTRAKNAEIAGMDTEIARLKMLARNRKIDVAQREIYINQIVELEKKRYTKTKAIADEAVSIENEKLLKIYGINIQTFKKIFADINNITAINNAETLQKEVMFEATKLAAKKTGGRYIAEVVQREYWERVKLLGEEQRLLLIGLDIKKRFSEEEQQLILSKLTEQEKATTEYYENIGSLARLRNRIENDLNSEQEQGIKATAAAQKDEAKILDELKNQYKEMTVYMRTNVDTLRQLQLQYEQTRREQDKVLSDFGVQKLDELTTFTEQYAAAWANVGYEVESVSDKIQQFLDDNKNAFQQFTEIGGGALNLYSEIANLQNQRTQEQIANIDAESEARINNLNKELMGEEMYAAAVKSINADVAKQKNELAVKQAKLDKSAAIFNATLASAEAVLNILAKFGATPLSAILIALTLGKMGTQIAAINAAPLPAYAKGRKGGDEEVAWTGERGSELVYGSVNGKPFAYLTPNQATLTYLPKGASVVPHKETMDLMQNQIDVSLLSDKLTAIENAIRNKPESSLNITRDGLYLQIKHGNSTTNYINGLKA